MILPTLRRLSVSLARHSKHLQIYSRMLSLPAIEVTPQLGLINDDLHISVNGLQAGQKVTLQTFLNESGLKFISCGHYVADRQGVVNVSHDASLGGTYDGVESTGLIWSMEQAPGQRPGLRLMKRDAKTPYDIDLLVYDGHFNIEECYQRQDQ